MATCKECFHYEVCKYWIDTFTEHIRHDWEYVFADGNCEDFKDKTKYVEQTNEHKCTKKENSYSFYVRCTCGAELNVDIYYWNDFKLCPNCGAKMDGE